MWLDLRVIGKGMLFSIMGLNKSSEGKSSLAGRGTEVGGDKTLGESPGGILFQKLQSFWVSYMVAR